MFTGRHACSLSHFALKREKKKTCQVLKEKISGEVETKDIYRKRWHVYFSPHIVISYMDTSFILPISSMGVHTRNTQNSSHDVVFTIILIHAYMQSHKNTHLGLAALSWDNHNTV